MFGVNSTPLIFTVFENLLGVERLTGGESLIDSNQQYLTYSKDSTSSKFRFSTKLEEALSNTFVIESINFSLI